MGSCTSDPLLTCEAHRLCRRAFWGRGRIGILKPFWRHACQYFLLIRGAMRATILLAGSRRSNAMTSFGSRRRQGERALLRVDKKSAMGIVLPGGSVPADAAACALYGVSTVRAAERPWARKRSFASPLV